MSELRVDSVKSKGGGAPNLPKGVTISGIATAATLGATTIDVSNVNVSGVVTSATLNGPLLSTGTPTLGLGVTINSSGVAISGVATAGIVSATTLFGDGTNITGVGATIAPLFYNPDPYDTLTTTDTGIGITFNSQVKAGTGNVTLSIANAGVAGTVVENFGVGSSVTISENRITINPTADLSAGFAQYFISYPSGCFTNNEGTAYAGTGYTFGSSDYNYDAYIWGHNNFGQLGLNDTVHRSSPVQLPGTTWSNIVTALTTTAAVKTDGTLWTWGRNDYGALGQGQASTVKISSPVQVGSGTNWKANTLRLAYDAGMCCKTDGTLWSWGYGSSGRNGNNTDNTAPAPVEIHGGGTTWDKTFRTSLRSAGATKTDGTLWMWGENSFGQLGQNQPNTTHRSSPVQVPGTTWANASGSYYNIFATKTDGTMWVWGSAKWGNLGQNAPQNAHRSSPTQLPGTTWSNTHVGMTYHGAAALKTDGTFWSWGNNTYGTSGTNETWGRRSSPVQLTGNTWSTTVALNDTTFAIRTDGTLWAWGSNQYGTLNGVLDEHSASRSSPVQIGSDTDWFADGWSIGNAGTYHLGVIRRS